MGAAGPAVATPSAMISRFAGNVREFEHRQSVLFFSPTFIRFVFYIGFV